MTARGWETLRELSEERFQPTHQRRALGFPKVFHRLRENGCWRDLRQGDESTGRCSADEHRSPIARIGFAVSQAGAFQPVDETGRCGPGNTEHAGEVAGTQRSENDEKVQRREVTVAGRQVS